MESKLQRCTCCGTQQMCAGAPTLIQPTSAVQHFGSTAIHPAMKVEPVMQPPESVFGFGYGTTQALPQVNIPYGIQPNADSRSVNDHSESLTQLYWSDRSKLENGSGRLLMEL